MYCTLYIVHVDVAVIGQYGSFKCNCYRYTCTCKCLESWRLGLFAKCQYNRPAHAAGGIGKGGRGLSTWEYRAAPQGTTRKTVN